MTQEPKTKAKKPRLTKKLIRELEARGIKFADDGKLLPSETPTPKVKKPATKTKTPTQKTETFSLAGNGDEEDTYKCGNCGAELESEVEVCPKCDTKLEWE